MATTRAKRTSAAWATALLGAMALTVTGVTGASAHVSIDTDSTAAGSHTVLTFSVPHGCETSATVKVAIQLPIDIATVTPTRNAYYTVEKTVEHLDPVILDDHGHEVSERVSQVVYHATTPLPPDQRDTFSLALLLPTNLAGSTLYFPTVQTCEVGEIAWAQIPAEGQDPHTLEYPAPSLVVTEANVDAHADSQGHGETGAASNTALVVTSLALGAVGVLIGLLALVRSFRHP